MGYNPQIKSPMWAARTNVARWYDKKGLPQPVGLWPMWESSGNIAFNYGSGALQNSNVFGSGASFKADGVFYDGSSTAQVVLEPEDSFNQSEFTIVVTYHTLGDWETGGSDANNNTIIIARNTNTSSQNGWIIRILPTTGVLYLSLYTTNWVNTIFGGSGFNIGNHTIAASIKQTTGTDSLYGDGKLISSEPGCSWAYTSDSRLKTGHDGNTYWEEFKGTIKQVVLFSQQLNAKQVALLYEEPYGALNPISVPKYFFVSAAPPSFQAAWARNANTILQPGVF